MSFLSSSLAKPPFRRLLAVTGTGIVVMLADTDAGSIITAAQSGAQWGYRLLLLQFILMPILYVVQELTVRLGVVTGRGHGELILQRFGRGWAWLSVSTLAVACLGALVSELSGLAGVGLLFGVPAWATMVAVIGGLITVVWTASYRSVERTAIVFGSFELVFVYIAWRAHPESSRGARRACPYAFRQSRLSLPRNREYRRGDHALDGLLPAVCGYREKSAPRTP